MPREPPQCGMINLRHAHSAAPTEIMIRQGTMGPLPAAAWQLRGLGVAGAERALCPCQLGFRTAGASGRCPGARPRQSRALLPAANAPVLARPSRRWGGRGLRAPHRLGLLCTASRRVPARGTSASALPSLQATVRRTLRIIPDAKYGPGSLASAKTFHCEHGSSLSSPTAVMRS